jgi:hypothetical protein
MQQTSMISNQPQSIKKLNRFIRTLSLFKVPLLGICGPKVIKLTHTEAQVQLPFKFLTKNHLGSMYFGALAMGAELSIALTLLDRMRREKIPVSFIFKDFACEFHKRAESNVNFVTNQVHGINQLIDQTLKSPERQNGTFEGSALSEKTGEKLMSYRLTISLKRYERKNQ